MAHTSAGARTRRKLTAALALAALLTIGFSSSALANYCEDGYDPAGSEWKISLRSVSAPALWVSAELGYGGGDRGMLRARTTDGGRGSWETFTIRCLRWGQFALRAANGKWVSVEMGYGGADRYMLRARADTIGDWEKFSWADFTRYEDGTTLMAKVRIRSFSNERLVAAEFGFEGDNKGMLRASGGWYTTFELWRSL